MLDCNLKDTLNALEALTVREQRRLYGRNRAEDRGQNLVRIWHLLALDSLEQGLVQLLSESAPHHVSLCGLAELLDNHCNFRVIQIGWDRIAGEDLKQEFRSLDRLCDKALHQRFG